MAVKREATGGAPVEISTGPKEPEQKIVRVDASRAGRGAFAKFVKENTLYALDLDIEEPVGGEVFSVEFIIKPLSMFQMQEVRNHPKLTPEEREAISKGTLDGETWAKSEAIALDMAVQNWTMVAKDPKDCDIEGGEFPVKLLSLEQSQLLSVVVNASGGRFRPGPYREYLRTHLRKVGEGVRPPSE